MVVMPTMFVIALMFGIVGGLTWFVSSNIHYTTPDEWKIQKKFFPEDSVMCYNVYTTNSFSCVVLGK